MKNYFFNISSNRIESFSDYTTFPCFISTTYISSNPPTTPLSANEAYCWKDDKWEVIPDFSNITYYDRITKHELKPNETPDPSWTTSPVPFTNQELIDAGKLTLADIKNNIKRAIDTKTDSIIAAGYTFDGNIFSLSTEAQLNWTGLKNFIDNGMVTFPLALSTKDDKEYSLKQADVTNFFVGMFQQITGAVDSGRALKLQVNAMTTLAALEAFVDPR